MNITLAQAEAAIKAAKAKATDLNLLMNISIVDSGANLVAFARMDGAWLGSGDISIRKAKTSAWFFMNTGDIGGLSQPGGPLYNIEHSNGGLITAFRWIYEFKIKMVKRLVLSAFQEAPLKMTTRLQKPAQMQWNK